MPSSDFGGSERPSVVSRELRASQGDLHEPIVLRLSADRAIAELPATEAAPARRLRKGLLLTWVAASIALLVFFSATVIIGDTGPSETETAVTTGDNSEVIDLSVDEGNAISGSDADLNSDADVGTPGTNARDRQTSTTEPRRPVTPDRATSSPQAAASGRASEPTPATSDDTAATSDSPSEIATTISGTTPVKVLRPTLTKTPLPTGVPQALVTDSEAAAPPTRTTPTKASTPTSATTRAPVVDSAITKTPVTTQRPTSTTERKLAPAPTSAPTPPTTRKAAPTTTTNPAPATTQKPAPTTTVKLVPTTAAPTTAPPTTRPPVTAPPTTVTPTTVTPTTRPPVTAPPTTVTPTTRPPVTAPPTTAPPATAPPTTAPPTTIPPVESKWFIRMPACDALESNFFQTSKQYWGLGFQNDSSTAQYWQVRIRDANYSMPDLSDGNLTHQQRQEADGSWTHVFSGTNPLRAWGSASIIIDDGVDVADRALQGQPEYFCISA